VADPVTRTAARIAVLVAVPLALLAGIGTFILLSNTASGSPEDPAAAESPASAAPVDTPVTTEARTLTEWEEVVCRALLANLPTEVGELAQRRVTAGPEQNAAFGDPAITLACGVPAVDYEPTDQVWPVSGVCWYADEREDSTVLTTLDREVPVSVTVPVEYDAPLQQVAGFAEPIRESIPDSSEAPSGCREP